MYSQKLNFVDEIENLRNENIALKRAVESKSAAIGILRNELQECQKERDDFRNMAENHPVISQPLSNLKTIPACPERTSAILGGSENTLAQLLSQSKEENKALRIEISDLKCRLHDAQSDLKILRGEKSRKADSQQCRLSVASSSQLAQQERESLIQQLEELFSKCQIQESDLRCLLEEREELVKERDEIRHKWHRLNHMLNKILVPSYSPSSSLAKNGEKIKPRKKRRIVDLDAIIAENRYLQQRLKQVHEEKALIVSNATKYKTALERGRVRPNSNSSNKLGFTDTLIMSPKQVAEFLKEHNIDSHVGEGGAAASKDLKVLCVALLDSLNQKSRFIKTQKTANKMLIERVTNLERQVLIESDEENHKVSSTTPMEINLLSASLMEGYNPSVTSNDLNSENVDHMLNVIQREIEDEERIANTNEEEEIEEEIMEKCNNGINNRDICNSDNVSITDDKSDSEEIVPLENLDKYISDLREKRRKDSLKVSQRNKNDVSNSEYSDDLSEDTLEEEKGEISTLDIQNNCTPKNPNVENKEIISSIKATRNNLSPSMTDGDKLQNLSPQTHTAKHKNRSKSPMSSSSSSFDIEISDYESDDDTFEQTLCNWQAECDKASVNRQTLIAKLSPKKSNSSMSRILKSRKVELPEKLKGTLN